MLILKEKPKQVAPEHYLLHLESEFVDSAPGQFINIRCTKQYDPLLRRPFSIFDHEQKMVSIIVKTVGRGTEILSQYAPGSIDCIGPLGSGFRTIKNSKVLIAGGGVGNSPLFYLAKKLSGIGCDITYIFGASTRSSVFMAERFERYVKRFIITTDDGTEGEKGFATGSASELLGREGFDMIYACGPRPMMKKMVELARHTPIEVSLENYFGCGIGLCSGCTIEAAGGLKKACVDGPVFNGADINWDTVPD
jgi:dihydroorotate dehydrogenase electron transfer subunit